MLTVFVRQPFYIQLGDGVSKIGDQEAMNEMFWLMVSALMVLTLNTGVILHIRRARECRSANRFITERI